MLHILTRASAEKFPGGGNGKKTKNSTIKPIPGGQRKKDPKITKKTET